MDVGLPIVGVRVAEGRCGTTLLMQLLATSPAIVFDERYPAEYRFASYFARMSEMMTEPFDEGRHPGVTSFFFDEPAQWGPIPFRSDIIDVHSLAPDLLRSLWRGWSERVSVERPQARYYAEKLAVPVDAFVRAGLDCRVIDVVRDPRDMLASIRAFTAHGIDGFGRRAGQTEDEYTEEFILRVGASFEHMAAEPTGRDRTLVRYEDMAADLPAVARSLGGWLGVELDADVVLSRRADYQHHITTTSPEASIGRWRNDLPPSEADRVTRELQQVLTAFGYEP